MPFQIAQTAAVTRLEQFGILNQVSNPNGLWIRKPTASIAVVFVHGLLSDGESCWTSGSVYWPDLLAKENDISEAGIYVFSYRTDVLAGKIGRAHV